MGFGAKQARRSAVWTLVPASRYSFLISRFFLLLRRVPECPESNRITAPLARSHVAQTPEGGPPSSPGCAEPRQRPRKCFCRASNDRPPALTSSGISDRTFARRAYSGLNRWRHATFRLRRHSPPPGHGRLGLVLRRQPQSRSVEAFLPAANARPS